MENLSKLTQEQKEDISQLKGIFAIQDAEAYILLKEAGFNLDVCHYSFRMPFTIKFSLISKFTLPNITTFKLVQWISSLLTWKMKISSRTYQEEKEKEMRADMRTFLPEIWQHNFEKPT